MTEGGRLISPEEAQFIDSDLELEQLKGGLYRTSAYWSESEKFWFDAANLVDSGNGQSGSPFSQITDWGQHIEPRLCIADGPSLRRYIFRGRLYSNVPEHTGPWGFGLPPWAPLLWAAASLLATQ